MSAIMTITLTGSEASRVWSLIEYTAPPLFPGPPPHLHEETQESFVVLEGSLDFVVGDQRISATDGTFVTVPPGAQHTFSNPVAHPATYLAWFSPIGSQEACEELAALIVGEPVWPPADSHWLTALCRRHRSALAAP